MNKDASTSKKVSGKRKFVNDKYLCGYQKPKMVDTAQKMLCDENLSEEGFLGAQAVLLINGIL